MAEIQRVHSAVRQVEASALRCKEFILDWLAQFQAKVLKHQLASDFPPNLALANLQFDIDRQYRAFQPNREDIQLYDSLL